MAVTANSVVTPQTPKRGLAQILPADTTTLKTVITPGADGAKVTSLNACSDDTSNRIVQVVVTRSAVDYLLGSAVVPTLAGTDGVVPTVDLLTLLPLPRDNDGQKYLLLENGDVLKVKSTTTVTAAKTINVAANYASF